MAALQATSRRAWRTYMVVKKAQLTAGGQGKVGQWRGRGRRAQWLKQPGGQVAGLAGRRAAFAAGTMLSPLPPLLPLTQRDHAQEEQPAAAVPADQRKGEAAAGDCRGAGGRGDGTVGCGTAGSGSGQQEAPQVAGGSYVTFAATKLSTTHGSCHTHRWSS